jgi:hypothetical protein
MQKRRRNTEIAPQSKRHQGSETEQQLVNLDRNPSLTSPVKATTPQTELPNRARTSIQAACDPDVVVPKEQDFDLIEVDQNQEEEENVGMSFGIIRVSKKDNYVTRFWFECCMCEHPLNSASKSCNKCPHECCEDCYAKRSLSSDVQK